MLWCQSKAGHLLFWDRKWKDLFLLWEPGDRQEEYIEHIERFFFPYGFERLVQVLGGWASFRLRAWVFFYASNADFVGQQYWEQVQPVYPRGFTMYYTKVRGVVVDYCGAALAYSTNFFNVPSEDQSIAPFSPLLLLLLSARISSPWGAALFAIQSELVSTVSSGGKNKQEHDWQ